MSQFKLGRKQGHRDRTLRNLATSLFLYEKVVTTKAKAHAVVPMVERLITKARSGEIAGRRAVLAELFDVNAVRKLFLDLEKRQGGRTSGFTRITKLPARHGDGAPLASLELLFTPLETVLADESQTKVRVRKTTKKIEPSAE